MRFEFKSAAVPNLNPLYNKRIFKIATTVTSVFFLLSAMVVSFSFFANPGRVKLSSSADNNRQVRVWIEPNNIITGVGKNTELTVMAEYDAEADSITQLQVGFNSEASLNMDKNYLLYKSPFDGKVAIGKIVVTPNVYGNYKINIPQESVVVTNLSNKPINIITSPATLVAQ